MDEASQQRSHKMTERLDIGDQLTVLLFQSLAVNESAAKVVVRLHLVENLHPLRVVGGEDPCNTERQLEGDLHAGAKDSFDRRNRVQNPRVTTRERSVVGRHERPKSKIEVAWGAAVAGSLELPESVVHRGHRARDRIRQLVVRAKCRYGVPHHLDTAEA